MKYPEIEVGVPLANKLKEFFYPGQKWDANIAYEIGYRMAAIKRIARTYYPQLDEVGRLRILGDMNSGDIEALYQDWPELAKERPGHITTFLGR